MPPVYNTTRKQRTIFRKLPRLAGFNLSSTGKGPLVKLTNTTYGETTADGTSISTAVATDTAVYKNSGHPFASH